MKGPIAALVVVMGLTACTMVSAPPHDLVAKHDHAALAAWYEKDAAHLRQRAKDMQVMAEEYRKNPDRVRQEAEVHPPKVDFIQQCKVLEKMYTQAAEEAEKLVTAHREMSRK
ncbi:MAG: hypothetical protein ACREJU_20925 [Nitrospiraceae bacterium]